MSNTIQSDEKFLEYVRAKKSEGLRESEIAKSLGLSTPKYRQMRHDCIRRKNEKGEAKGI